MARRTNEEINEGIFDSIPFIDIPYQLKDDGNGREITWNPCENWAQLGWLLEYTEELTGGRLVLESSVKHHHDCTLPANVKSCMNGPHRALYFCHDEGLNSTTEHGKRQLAWLIWLELKRHHKANEGVLE